MLQKMFWQILSTAKKGHAYILFCHKLVILRIDSDVIFFFHCLKMIQIREVIWSTGTKIKIKVNLLKNGVVKIQL